MGSDRKLRAVRRRVGGSGEYLSCFGNQPSNETERFHPLGMAIDKDSNILVCNRDNESRSIQTWSPEFTFLFSFRTDRTPQGIAISSTGRLVVAFYPDQVGMFASNKGELILNLENRDAGCEKMGWEFEDPVGVSIDNHDNIFINELREKRVRMFDQNGKFIRIFCEPEAILWFSAIDMKGNLVVSTDTEILIVNPIGEITKVTRGWEGNPIGIAINRRGNIVFVCSTGLNIWVLGDI